jgi:hypothetical protein
MAIAAVAMIGGIVIYTPYVRYWLPAYPLLVASCVLAAGSLIRSIRRQPQRPWLLALSGIVLAGLLLLPAPLLHFHEAWGEYTKRISTEQRREQRFAGYQAVKQLNPILAPDDGVICTYFDGVHLVGGRPYGFGLWWNGVYHIHDPSSFADFCLRYGIRYWIVDHFPLAMRSMNGAEDIAAEYWTDARMVTAWGTLAVYDVATRRLPRWRSFAQYDWPAVLEKTEKVWTASDASAHWVNLTTDSASSPGDGAIVLKGQERIGHRLQPECRGGLCKVEAHLWSQEPTFPLLQIVWYDAAGNLAGRMCGGFRGKSDYEACLYAPVPPGAEVGWVHLWEWKGAPMSLKHAAVKYWQGMRGARDED